LKGPRRGKKTNEKSGVEEKNREISVGGPLLGRQIGGSKGKGEPESTQGDG